MRILMLIDWNPGRGGAEAFAINLRDGLNRAGDQVRLLTSSAGSMADGSADYVAFAPQWRSAQGLSQIHNPFAAATVRRAVEEFRPDVAWVNMFAQHLSPSVLGALGAIPIVLYVTDYKLVCPLGTKLLPDGTLCPHQAGRPCLESGCMSLPHWLRDQLRYLAIRRAIARVRSILVCSQWMAQVLREAGWSSEVIYIPAPSLRPGMRRPASTPTFFYFGRLDREKGVALLLEAFARLSDPANLRIAGEGPLLPELRRQASDLGLEERVRFLGWQNREEIDRELMEAWAVVVPSLWAEPLGMVAQEAVVKGVPVIASACGGLGEVIEDGVSGLLFPNGDADALSDCLARVAACLAFPSHSLDGSVALAMAKRFDHQGTIHSWRRIFAGAMGHHASVVTPEIEAEGS